MKTVETFYDETVEKEWSRLDRHPLEFEITKRYLDKYILNQSKILDIGGGPGRYSFYLKTKGHFVSLLDLSSQNIAYAKSQAKELSIELDDYRQANVLELGFIEKESFDVVLCLGPLYHLTNKEDQVKAINECLRVLKQNGIIYISFISKFAQAVSLINKEPEKILEWRNYFEQVMETGINKGDIDLDFTDSFFFYPNEIETLMENFPLKKISISGVEGLFAQSEEKLKKLDRRALEEWIDYTFKFSTHPSVLGACQHILYIGNKI
jgi:2-polyprenyl-3-methyl-5-hydroxy-6-metoxy-1,4-benzoquinol methylase